MKNDLLDIDVRLLLLRYSKGQVLQAIARLGEQKIEELEQQMNAIGKRAKPKRAKPSLMDLVEVEAAGRPEISDPLRSLAVGFENRTFLPQLRDVQRFLDRIGMPHSKLKSRIAAAPAVIRALGKLDSDELAKLTADKSGNDSDYSLLARAIMGTPSAKPPRTDEKS